MRHYSSQPLAGYVTFAAIIVLGLKRQLPLADVECILTWQDGEHLGSPDDVILINALRDWRVVVTYDLATMPSAIQSMASNHGQHPGVLFIDTKTLRPNDIGGLVRALQSFVMMHARSEHLNNQVHFLRTAND